MTCSVTQLKDFYACESGALVRSVLQGHIDKIWPDVRGYRVMGMGYAVPYLSGFLSKDPERVIAMMPGVQGAQYWPYDDRNVAFFSDEALLPVETSSIDRALLVHYLEGVNNPRDSVQELWRVLKPNGRALVIVPNRMGAWSRAQWSPFGSGCPFSYSQLEQLLCRKLFEPYGHFNALFVPPMSRWPFIMRKASFFERVGGAFCPFAGGVHIIEVNKRVFAGIDKTGGGSSVFAKTKELLGVKDVVLPQNYKTD